MNKFCLGIVVCLVLIMQSCTGDKPVVIESAGGFQELRAAVTGLDFSNDLTPNQSLNIIEYLYYYNGGGVAVGDINNDGLDDILLSANQKPDQLYLNKGDLQFENITEKSGIAITDDWSSGVSMDDINGDGLLDIYICKVDPIIADKVHNLLYINNGDASFTESSKAYGLDFAGYSTQASFFDYDNDGDLDMYLLNHSVHTVRSYGQANKRNEKDDLSGDRLYENKMNETEKRFVDVTEAAGVYSSALGYGLAVVTSDINEDGYMDIYVGNDFHENDYIYINNGDKTFTESMATLLNHSSKFTMGADIADINGDGHRDIFTTDMLPYDKIVALKSGGEDTDQIFKIRSDFGFEDQYARNHFQLQQQEGYFVDVALQHDMYATDWSWSVLMQDFDNNGLKDVFITNGIVQRPNDLDYINFLDENASNLGNALSEDQYNQFMANMPSQALRNILFSQDSSMTFTKVKNSEIGTAGFSNGAAYSDLDNDGDLDLIINNINSPASILKNKSDGSKNYISLSLKIADSSTTAKGTKVNVYAGSNIYEQEYITTRGYQSSSTHKMHFGLGSNTVVDSIVVIWPGKVVQIVKDVQINAHQMIIKGDVIPAGISKKKIASNYNFKELGIRHLENKYEDYNQEKLIPELLSKEGPAIVSADFNNDNIADLFIGGARLQEPVLMYGFANGTYRKVDNKDFRIDAKYEDVDAVAFDYENDGDMDLYIVSGGSDRKELDKTLEDRLYLNDGKGNLRRLPVSLPHTNGSTVSVGDMDGDGYLDLFIGARSIPGSYGLSPFSFVLKNKQGLGIDLIEKKRYGMITDSQWADMDNDGDMDIVICGDWMNITILNNNGDGTLTAQSSENGLSQSSGLWNSLLLEDFNGDGQLDILAANVGTNFKWKASATAPVKMDVLDIDKNAQTESLIFVNYFGEYMPFISLTQLVSQAPALKKKFLKNSDYSTVSSIDDLQLADKSEVVEHKELTELRSMIYLSENGVYRAVALNDDCQKSTIQSFTKGKNGKILYVGNHLDYLTNLGKNTGCSGGILSNFDSATSTFNNAENLGLNKKMNTRDIIKIDDSKYLIAVNNGEFLLMEEKR